MYNYIRLKDMEILMYAYRQAILAVGVNDGKPFPEIFNYDLGGTLFLN